MGNSLKSGDQIKILGRWEWSSDQTFFWIRNNLQFIPGQAWRQIWNNGYWIVLVPKEYYRDGFGIPVWPWEKFIQPETHQFSLSYSDCHLSDLTPLLYLRMQHHFYLLETGELWEMA